MADTEYYKKITKITYEKYMNDRDNENYFYLFKIIYKIYLNQEYDNDDNDVNKIYRYILNSETQEEDIYEDNDDDDEEEN